MGGKSHADNDQVVEEQKRQAEEAKRKEAERQARLNLGLKKIGFAFEGKPITTPTAAVFDWNTLGKKGSALPPGFKTVYVNAKGQILKDIPATEGGFSHDINAGQPGVGGSAGTGTLHQGSPGVSAGDIPGAVTALQGADGKIYMPGQKIKYTWNKPTGGRTGGFDDEFYNDYRDSITDYYNPQVAEQYGDAQDELTYRLARAGTLRSSGASDEQADLLKQNELNLAGIANKADTETGNLRAKVASEKQKATNQLYATENPEVAANQALAAVRDISLQQADLSPLAEIFKLASVGAAKFVGQGTNNRFIGDFESGLPGHQGSSREVTG